MTVSKNRYADSVCKHDGETAERREQQLQRSMEVEIWPHTPAAAVGDRITNAEREEILGIGPRGYCE